MNRRTDAVMGTLVTVEIVAADCGDALDRAFRWFHEVETRCSRFLAESELRQVCGGCGEAIAVSAILFEAVRFALLVAEESGGAFDPTVGRSMEARGFDKEHRSGQSVTSGEAGTATYRDVELDGERQTITLHRPLTLDLGAVAKGLAVDLAARELAPWRDFAIDAGGDLYLGGRNGQGEAWSVGVRHPDGRAEWLETLRVSDRAVCTSGNYERGAHILDARCGRAADAVVSATVIADGAMLADALATAAFVLGPRAGIEFLHRMEVEGLIVTADWARYSTRGLAHAA